MGVCAKRNATVVETGSIGQTPSTEGTQLLGRRKLEQADEGMPAKPSLKNFQKGEQGGEA